MAADGQRRGEPACQGQGRYGHEPAFGMAPQETLATPRHGAQDNLAEEWLLTRRTVAPMKRLRPISLRL